jgi:superfamily II DNA or RNA helicase
VRALGRTLVGITSCDLISEGFDCPGAVAGLLVRPTASLSLHLQQVGRILRHVPGKTAMLLDFVGNYLRHQLPDTPREWSLSAGVVKREREAIECPDVRACDKCYAVHEWALACPYCGYVYPVKEKAGPKQEKGYLREMTPEEIAALEALARRTGRLADYHAAEKARAVADGRDYKPGSAWYKWKNRSRRAVGG